MRVFLLLLALWSGSAFADSFVYSKQINFASTNLAAAYNTSYPQLTLTGLTSAQNHLSITAPATGICCDVETRSVSTAPTAGNGHELCVTAGLTKMWDFVPINGNVYCRGMNNSTGAGTSITTGLGLVEVW